MGSVFGPSFSGYGGLYGDNFMNGAGTGSGSYGFDTGYANTNGGLGANFPVMNFSGDTLGDTSQPPP